MTKPRPDLTANISATMTRTHASPMPKRKPVKMNGIAAGTTTRGKIM